MRMLEQICPAQKSSDSLLDLEERGLQQRLASDEDNVPPRNDSLYV